MSNAVTPDYRLRDVFVSGFDAGRAIPYTGRNRERPLSDDAVVHPTAIRAAHHGDATDYYLMKESGVQDTQDDPYAPRRAQLEAQFQALPPVGGDDYWRRIEEPIVEQRLPLEVLARCLRERIVAGVRGDAERIYNVIAQRIKRKVGGWARSIASQARSGTGSQDPEDLEQGCYMKLWEDLAGDGRTFLPENFMHGLERICQHVAHREMEKSGDWQRKGVKTPTRVPRGEMQRLPATQESEGDAQQGMQSEDATAQDAFDLAEYSDLFDKIHGLPADLRKILYDRFYRDRTQEETAADLGITDRTVRKRLKALLEDLRRRYQSGEEDTHV
jgi:RNA polymerase sigma factor (sigma-70 family)